MRKLIAADGDFSQQLHQLLAHRAESQASVAQTVTDIIDQVRQGGDAAVKQLTQQFDQCHISNLRLDEDVWRAQAQTCPMEVAQALELSAKRIADYSTKQLPSDTFYTDDVGVELGWK